MSNDSAGVGPVERGVRRLLAKQDIVGRLWTFPKGKRLVGKRGEHCWSVWPRNQPDAFIVGVPDDLVRVLEDA